MLENTEGEIKNGQPRETGNIGYTINVREYRRGNKKWTTQRIWQHRAHKTTKNKPTTQHKLGMSVHRTVLKFSKPTLNYNQGDICLTHMDLDCTTCSQIKCLLMS
jgi:hypothetical protein